VTVEVVIAVIVGVGGGDGDGGGGDGDGDGDGENGGVENGGGVAATRARAFFRIVRAKRQRPTDRPTESRNSTRVFFSATKFRREFEFLRTVAEESVARGRRRVP
jgi:hypothetical protein